MSASLGWLAVGCSHGKEPPDPVWAKPSAAYVPARSSRNAFDGYALAALEAERNAGPLLSRINFTGRYRREAEIACKKAIQVVERATTLPCQVEFRPVDPFAAPPFQRGWRLLGRLFAWRIERAASSDEPGKALGPFLDATKFGFDLTGGAASDASLGFSIVDEARRALTPAINNLGAGQLGELAAKLTLILRSRPPLEATIRHELQNMLAAVQFVLDCTVAQKFEVLERALGPSVKESIAYLKEKGPKRVYREQFFRGFAQEAEEECNNVIDRLGKPAAERTSFPDLKSLHRPWRRFAPHFLLTARSLLSVQDRTIARTRLLIIESRILQAIKVRKGAPTSLGEFSRDLTTDPYSGKAFVYHANGTDYRLYSVGQDLKDDLGDTDETSSSPDLWLETRG